MARKRKAKGSKCTKVNAKRRRSNSDDNITEGCSERDCGEKRLRSLYEGLQGLSQCGVCLEQATDPRVLPCIHTFCLHCIQQAYYTGLTNAQHNHGGYRCSVCRACHPIPVGGLECLPTDHRIHQLKDVIGNHRDVFSDIIPPEPQQRRKSLRVSTRAAAASATTSETTPSPDTATSTSSSPQPMLTCAECSMQFPTRELLILHLRQHDEFCYVCDICGCSFATPTWVLAHRRSRHSSAMEVDISVLTTRVRQPMGYRQGAHWQALRTQEAGTQGQGQMAASGVQGDVEPRTFSPPRRRTGLRCPVCRTRMEDRAHLQRHLETHPNLCYVCDVCQMGFTDAVYCYNHRLRRHPNAEPLEPEELAKQVLHSRN